MEDYRFQGSLLLNTDDAHLQLLLQVQVEQHLLNALLLQPPETFENRLILKEFLRSFKQHWQGIFSLHRNHVCISFHNNLERTFELLLP